MANITSFGTPPALNSLLLPDGRRCGDVGQAELCTLFSKYGIDDFAHSRGLGNVELYARHLEKIAAEAGQRAIAAWMAEKRSV
jgi:hypothetical protein